LAADRADPGGRSRRAGPAVQRGGGRRATLVVHPGRRRAPGRDGPGRRGARTARGDRVHLCPRRVRAGRGVVRWPVAGRGEREAVPRRALVLLPARTARPAEHRRAGRPGALDDHRASLVEPRGPAGGDRADRAARPGRPDGPAAARRHPRAPGAAAKAPLAGRRRLPGSSGFPRGLPEKAGQGARVARRVPSGAAWNTVAFGPRSRTAARSPGSGAESLTRAAASREAAPLDTAIATASRSADNRSDGRATAA